MTRILTILALVLAAPGLALAQRGGGTAAGRPAAVQIDHDAIRAMRIASATRITEKITLDGKLDEIGRAHV